MEKTIRKYSKAYRKALTFRKCRDIGAKAAAYEARLREMYASDGFKAHSVYPTTNATHVYAVIAMCLEMKAFGLTDAEIIEAVNQGFARRRSFFRRIIRAIDLLPNSFSIAKNGIFRIMTGGSKTAASPMTGSMPAKTGSNTASPNVCTSKCSRPTASAVCARSSA